MNSIRLSLAPSKLRKRSRHRRLNPNPCRFCKYLSSESELWICYEIYRIRILTIHTDLIFFFIYILHISYFKHILNNHILGYTRFGRFDENQQLNTNSLIFANFCLDNLYQLLCNVLFFYINPNLARV